MSRSKSEALAHFKGRIVKSLDIAKSYSDDAYARLRWLDHARALLDEAGRVIYDGGTFDPQHHDELKQIGRLIDGASV